MAKIAASPHPRYRIEEGGIAASGLISINAIDMKNPEVGIPVENFQDVLFLQFGDIPFPELVREGKRMKGPSIADVERAIAFAKKLIHENPAAKIAVHCQAGKSRSAAIALAVNVSLQPEHHRQVLRAMLEKDTDSQMCFNPRIVEITDHLLKVSPTIDSLLLATCVPYRVWKKYWKV
jgi:predicted protein tyrosine phosphatase